MSVSVASRLRARPVATQPPPRKADPHTLSRTGAATHPRVGGGCSSSAGAASLPVRPARAAG
jgi:hypothetical protein